MCMLRYKWYRGSVPSPINEPIPGCGHTEGWRVERCDEARARCRGTFCDDIRPILRLEDSYTMGDCRLCRGLVPFVPGAAPLDNPEQVDDPAYQEQEERRRQAEEERRQEQERREKEEDEELLQYDPQNQQGEEGYQEVIDRYEQERLRRRNESHRRYQEQNAEYARLQIREQVLLRRRMQQMEEDRWRRVEQFEAEQDEFLEKQRQKKDGQER